MSPLDLLAWSVTALVLAALALVRRHEARLPSLEADPPPAPDSPSVCLCIPVRNEVLELPAALDS